MEGIQDGEYVVGGHTQSSETEETETPGDSQHTAETHDGGYVGGAGLRAFQLLHLFPSFLPQHADPSEDHDEDAECEDEDEAVITNVHHIMRINVCDPAPVGTRGEFFVMFYSPFVM